MPDDLSAALIARLYASGLLDDKRNRLNQARVGGAAFGMPSMPPLGQDRPPEFSNAPTVREQMQSRPILNTAPLHAAAEMTGVPWWLRGGESPDTSQKGLGEFVREGVPAAVSAMPGGKLFSTVPRALATSTALSLAPMAPDLFSTSAEAATKKQQAPAAPAGPPPDDGLSDQQRARRDELNTQQKQDGFLPKSLREELKSINDTSTEYTKEKNKNKTKTEGIAAEAKAKRDAEEAERQAARKAFEEERSHTFAGRHPYAALAMQVGGSGLGAALGSYLKYRGAQNYTANMNDLMSRIADSVNRAQAATARKGPQALARADRLTQQAQALQEQANALKPGGRWAPLGLSLTGTEIGSGMPAIIDKSTEGKNPDLWQTGERVGLGALGGSAVGEFAGMAVPKPNRPPGYGAEIAALRAAIDARRRRRP